MEKIKLGLFDVFGFILPGLLITFAVTLPFFMKDSTLTELHKMVNDGKEVPITLFILLIAFIVGASIHQIGFIWYYAAFHSGFFLQLVFFKMIGSSKKKSGTHKITRLEEKFSLLKDNTKISENMVLIRQFVPEQLPALEEWTSKRAMSFNLSFSFFILAISTYNFIVDKYRTEGWSLIIFSLLASMMLLVRAYGYDYWWKSEMKLIMEKFELDKRKLPDNTGMVR